MTRHAWLQKHPSPQAAGGEFHWYPDAGDRELRASFVERVRGVEPPAVLWQLERGRVAWGQVFSAIAPLDGRRYVGLVLSVVEGNRPVAELLAALVPPRPEPWIEGVATETQERRAGAQELAAVRRKTRGDVAGVIRTLISGGVAMVEDPGDGELPLWIASLERLLPDAGPRPRCGAWRSHVARGSLDRVAALGAVAWQQPGSREAAAWTLLCELAHARGEPIDRVGTALEAIDAAGVLTDAERAELATERSVVGVLHAWGRGRFDRSAVADTLPARLADLVALRVLARLAAGADAQGAIAEARWYALLSAGRRTALLAAVGRRTASLRGLVEAVDA
jgi:hypothetical protein